tara:strand:+ start:725 stop:1030 length:306 start_codon:yes stop_codon:yes gene_type:complete
MEHALSKPEDYIDIASLIKPKRSLRNTMRETIKRFYDQPFTAWELTQAMEIVEPRLLEREALYATVRGDVRRMALEGSLAVAKQGSPGYGNPTIYMNKERV